MMLSKRWIAPLVVLGMWAFALAVYPRLPEQIPTHWSFRGEIDGWSARWPGAFIAPFTATVMVALLHLLPWIEPRRRNLAHFTEERFLIVNVLALFFALLEAITLGYALGWEVDVSTAMFAGIGLMLVVLGNYLPRLRSNWFMGIRTPWTMDNERVWRETHRVGGRTFVAGGLVMTAAAFLPGSAGSWVALGAVLVASLIPAVYSYVAWRRDRATDGA